MVGDRGMITTARINALRADNTATEIDLGWLTSLRHRAIPAVLSSVTSSSVSSTEWWK